MMEYNYIIIGSNESSTCSSEISCISCLALSIPSLVPLISIISDASLARGMVIFVAVASSSSESLTAFGPRMNRWCSFGIRTDPLD